MAMPLALWRPKVGAGQSLALANGAAASFANPIGTNTFAIALSAIGANCLVCVSPTGVAATARSDLLLKLTDPPLIIACTPGEHVSAWGLAAGGTLYMAEMTR